MVLTDLDKKIADEFRLTRNYSATARKVGLSRTSVERRIFKMRAGGIELPELAPLGLVGRTAKLAKRKSGDTRK